MKTKIAIMRMMSILLIIGLLAGLAACGEKEDAKAPVTDTSADSTPTQKAETYDTGNFKVSVPGGWKAFPQRDVFNDDPNAMNPNLLMIAKGATSDMDLYSSPCITVTYAGSGTMLMAPSRDYYDNVEALPNLTTGGHTWGAFQGESIYRWWSGDAYIKITFDIQSDGTETWNVTQYDGLG